MPEFTITTKLRNRIESDEQGFTLIELLVVILIIGILAAIAIPSFLNQRTKGQDACAKSMARTMQTSMETWYTEGDTYVATTANLGGVENQVTAGQCGSTSTITIGAAGSAGACTGSSGATSYCVSATSASGNSFSVNRSATGVITRKCTTTGTGSCPSTGNW